MPPLTQRTASTLATGFKPSNRVILLGAGATFGASFGFEPICRPPLNRDFFTQLQKITEKHTKLVRQVIDDVVDLFDSNFSLTLEDYFTQLEFLLATAEFSRAAESRRTIAALTAKRDRLMAALSAVLEMSTNRAITAGRGCEFHRRLVRELRPGDTVISFNYDCVLDDALRREGNGKWNAAYGYAFPPLRKITGAERWDPAAPAAMPGNTIYLLKLHGSLNWQFPPADSSEPIWIKQRLHQQFGTPRFTIIPPEWNKSARAEPIFNLLWRRAMEAVRKAEHVAIVGFSFTPTDLHVESLFRLALADAKLKTLVIANPSSADRGRIRKVFARALNRNKSVVRQYQSLGDMMAAWPECLTS